MSLGGRRILVLEDEMLVSMLIEELLSDRQCVVVGPFNDIEPALRAAQQEPLDAAVLDINVTGKQSFAVAEALERRRIPFVIVSGYGPAAIEAEHGNWRMCSKPFRARDLLKALSEQMAGAE